MFRIALIAIISLTTVLFFLFIVEALIQQEDAGMAVYVFVLSIGSALFPGLIAALVFSFLVKDIDRTKTTAAQKIKTGITFIVICSGALMCWLLGEWLLSGDRTWADLLHRSREFMPWLCILIPACTLMTSLYFSRFLSSLK